VSIDGSGRWLGTAAWAPMPLALAAGLLPHDWTPYRHAGPCCSVQWTGARAGTVRRYCSSCSSSPHLLATTDGWPGPWCLVQAIGDSDRPRKASARGVRARPLPPPRLLASQPALRAAYGEATGRSSNAFASAAATLQRRHGSAGSLYARTPAGAPAQPRPESSQRAKQHAAGARSQLSSTRQQGPAEQPDRHA